MRKLLLFSIALFAVQFLSAQVKFRIAIHPDLTTYSVFMRSDVDYTRNDVASCQLSMRVPAGGFDVGNIVSKVGVWSKGDHTMSPEEAPLFDYISFNPVTPTRDFPFVAGEEVELFTFENIGNCTGAMEFIINNEDPFWPPNNLGSNVGNDITVAIARSNVYAGSYADGGYACDGDHGTPFMAEPACDDITFNGIDFESPTTCGASDGSLSIFVTNDTGFDVVYSIDGGANFQSSPDFTGLTSGDYNIIIRDILSLCIEDVGSINVPGPLGPLVISQDLVNPDCGVDNGTITLHARTDFGDPVEFALAGGAFQSDSTFTGLGEGSYTFTLRNSANNCETIVGPFELTGCDPVECVVYYEIEQTTGGRYEIILLSDTTWATPGNFTNNLQVSFKVPTGGFQLDDLRTEVPGVTWQDNGQFIAPSQNPGFDYFSIGLVSDGGGAINYIKGQRVTLFSFANTGTCTGGDLELIENGNDPIFANTTRDVSQQLFTLGMGADVPICLNENNTAPCEPTPIPCIAEFEMSQLPNGSYQVSMTPNETLASNRQRLTELMNVTIRVPTGGFLVGNLMPVAALSGLEVLSATEATAPAAAPGFDYINITVGPLGTDLISFEQGQKVDLFTFENTGACNGGDVKIMDEDTDPYSSATAGLFLKVQGYGSDRVETCLNDVSFADCPPATTQRDTVYVTMTTDMASTALITSVLDLPNGTGTASVLTDGSFVTATATNGSDNIDLNPNGDFRQTDVITVVHCDATMTTLCDTTVIIICPQVQIAPVAPACAGSDFQITTTGGAGNFTWSGAILTGMNPSINLNQTTTLTLNTDNGNGCATTADVTITVNPLPTPSFTFAGTCSGEETVFTNTTPGNITDFSWEFGNAANTSDVENPNFTFGADGTYDVTLAVTDANGCSGSTVQQVTISAASMGGSRQDFTICAGDTLNFQAMGSGTDFVWSPSDFLSDATIANPQAIPPRSITYTVTSDGSTGGCGATVDTFHVNVNPSPIIMEVLREDVTDCDNPDGSIKITANADGDPLEYSIDCGVTWQTNSFFPDLDKGNYAPTVRNTVTGCISTWSKNFTLSGPSSPRIANVTSTQPTDCGVKDGTITFSSPDANVLFSIDGIDFVPDSVFTGLEAKTYTPQAKFNGDVCITNDTPITLLGGDEPVLAAPISELFVCEADWKTVKIAINDSIATYTITTTGVYTNEIKTDSVLSFDVASPVDSAEYSVELTAKSGCSVTEDFTAYKAENPTVTAKELRGSECLKSEGGFVLTLSGGTAPYTFDLLDPAGGFIFNDESVAGDMPINDLAAGDHDLQLGDTHGCLSKTTVTIALRSSDFGLTADVTHPNCNEADGSVILSGTGDSLTFEWRLDNNVVSLDSAATDLAAGEYSVFISNNATGCFQDTVFLLEDSGAPELVIENLMPVFCEGDANGGVAFHVNGSGDFFVKIPDAGIDTTVQGDESTMIFGLTGGTYEVVVADDGGCETIQEITIIENVMNIKADKVEPTQCDVADGSLCLTLTDGTGPYQITGAFRMNDVVEGQQVCFDNVESGRYEVQITDANNCEKSRTLVFTAPNQPVISTDSFAVAGLLCPEDGDNGSIISNSASVFSVYTLDSVLVGLTPVENLTAQTVILVENVNGCDAFLQIDLTAPEAWSTESVATLESCDGDDATLDVIVSGANGNYNYEWATGVTHIDGAATGLTAGTYNVTISDGEGCETIMADILVEKDLDCVSSCQPLFDRDIFNVTVPSSFPQVCLPLMDGNIAGQSIMLNGAPYGGFATICTSDVISYDVATLLGTGTAPFTVNGWFYGTTNLRSGFTFFTIQELVDKMNEVTPDGNWYYNESTEMIIGEGVMFFGDIVVAHAGSSELIMVSSTSEAVVRTAIEISGDGTHEVVLLDADGNCPDTLIIMAVEEFDGPDYPDTIAIATIMETTSSDMCRVNGQSLPAGAILTICDTPDNGSVEIDGTCYNYTPAPGFLGEDEFCLEICDGNDCQQVRVMVTVTSRDIVIHTGFSPNGDGINDALMIGNIEAFPENTVSVYNRWGNLVFKKEGYTNSDGWEGDFSGSILPDGTYFIIIETGEGERMTNYVQIIR